MFRLLTSLCVLCALGLSGPAAWAGPMQVFVTLAPQKHFVEKIGGEHVAVAVMVGPGANPHAYEPKPGQMKALTAATLYFAVGDPSERSWLDKLSSTNKSLRVVHTEEGIEKIPMAAHHDDEGEEHGHDEHGHEAGELDPHVWLSPSLVKIQAGHILAGLSQADPAHAADYQKNHDAFLKEIDGLDADIRSALSGLKPGAEFMVFHPSWGYFAKDYGLLQTPIEVEGKEPKPRELKDLLAHAKKLQYRVIFVQPQFSQRTAKTIADAIGAKLVPADPLAEKWDQNLREVAAKFRAAAR